MSILIPAFNAQEWISETLRSAIAQSWDRKEIIVVDDGSSDQTLHIARRFESSLVRVVTQRNQGAAATRNEAFRLSKGDYIQWLDADDLLAPDKIARQMEERRGSRTLLSCAWGLFLYRYDRAEFVPSELWSDLTPVDWLVLKMDRNLHMQTATWLVSRELTKAAGPWDTSLAVDNDGEYFCRVLLASDGVHFVPDAKVYYRLCGSNSVSYIGGSEKKIQSKWRASLLHVKYLRSLEDSERVRRACLNYLQTWLIHFYPERPDIVRQAEQLALELGGQLGRPYLSWKYSWIKALFGWRLAKRVRAKARDLRWALQRSQDRILFRLESRGSSGVPGL